MILNGITKHLGGKQIQMNKYVRESSYNPHDISGINYRIRDHDRHVLRDLARSVKEISQDPLMEYRKRRWIAHNSLKDKNPLVLVFPEGSWRELLPESALTCKDKSARCIEWELRKDIYQYENIQDDAVYEKKWIVTKSISDTGWGLEPKHILIHDDDIIGRMETAYGFEPVIHHPSDLKKLKHPELIYDEKDSLRKFSDAQELFGDILDIELKGTGQLSFCYTPLYTKLRGHTQVMMDMYDEPNMLHDAMAFFEQGFEKLIDQYVEMNLLSLNNDNTYHSSGGVGFTDELPAKGFDPDQIRPKDIWASSQSQEMAEISPDMHYEFVMKYEMNTLRHFGLNGYGCCEDLTRKLNYVFQIPHVRRISISPWADVEKCAEMLADKYVFSWKPNPAYLAAENFDEAFMKDYIRHTLGVAKGCVLEIILKDTHTCRHQPQRFAAWSRITRDLINHCQ